MAGKSGSAASRPSIDYLPKEVLGASTKGLADGWDAAKAIFDHKRADAALRGMLPSSGFRLAVALMFVGCLVGFAFTCLANLEFFYVLALETDALKDVVFQDIPKPDVSMIYQSAAANLIIYVPLALALNLVFERLGFLIARVSGGKGSFETHLTLSSVVWIGAMISTAASLLGPFYCLSFVSMAFLALVTLGYMLVYMASRAYSIAHDISFMHSAIIVILMLIPRLVIWFYASQMIAGAVGLPTGGA
jgi:hypothetical protein